MFLVQLITASIDALTPSVVSLFGSLLSLSSEALVFTVQEGAKTCNLDTCPGSQFTQIGAAWANIGYVTHSDVLRYINGTNFGLWAPLLYVCAALAALVGVAINMPLRSYMWFMIGPAIYSFLIGTTASVEGVNWMVANEPQDMTNVWRDAEVGLINTDSQKQGRLEVRGKYGPQRSYEVAMPMVFLDELFSATTNIMIEWLGVYRHEGRSSSDYNACAMEGGAEGPWHLLSNLKWSMLENIVAASARSPDFRDAFVTFLASECGDSFKKGIDSGSYAAASSRYGNRRVNSVMVGNDGNETSTSLGNYAPFAKAMNGVAIPTPRSLGRLLMEGKESPGQFGHFAVTFDPANGESLAKKGRTQGIVCSEYLYTLIQHFRFEAGHAYWQLVRSSPKGLDRTQFLRTLFYGWNIRDEERAECATEPQLNAFVKHLIMVYILRNELLFAPQITEANQRFAPSEQARSFSEAYVRTMGSKSKAQELYNWAALVPHLQGILVYFLLVAYPFAAMVMVLPGYYKTFFTWVSFFAWVKLWDVGFAIVMVLERSVWAMIGNNTSIASVANVLIKMAENAGGIGVGCPGSTPENDKDPANLCPVPNICSINGPDASMCGGQGEDPQSKEKAWYLLDKLLILSASADLDLANGYYIYIMAALYFAVPAVTGQLVLGAKAGAASMLNSAIGGVSGEAGKAALTGYQHQAVNQAYANNASLGQAAEQKGYRQAMAGVNGSQQSFASGVMGLDNEILNENQGKQRASLGANRAGLSAELKGNTSSSFDNAAGFMKKMAPTIANRLPGVSQLWNLGAVEGGNGKERKPGKGETAFNNMMDFGGYGLKDEAIDAKSKAAIAQSGFAGQQAGHDLRAGGYQTYRGNLEAAARQNAQMVAWEAKNNFASHASAMAGIAGMNTGALSPGAKPSDMRGMAMMGELDGYVAFLGTGHKRVDQDVKGAGLYSGGGYIKSVGDLQRSHQTAVDNTKGDYSSSSWFTSPGTALGAGTSSLTREGGEVAEFFGLDLTLESIKPLTEGLDQFNKK